MVITPENKESIKHFKDCLKMLLHPPMRDIVANYDVKINKYINIIKILEAKDE
jgi:hypothetical protein